MTLDLVTATQVFRLVFQSLAVLAVLVGLGLWGLALVSHRHMPILLVGGTIPLAAGGYVLWALA